MLRDYQRDGVNHLLNSDKNTLLQLATGGGKTFVFSYFIKEYLNKIEGNIVVLVHREELLLQTQETLLNIGICPEIISAKQKKINFSNRVFVCMVGTLKSKLKKNKSFLSNVHTIISDECHRNDFKVIFNALEHKRRIGFTATPVLMKPTESLSQTYNEIFVCRDIKELIEDGKLVKDVCYASVGNKDDFSHLQKSNTNDSGFTTVSVNKVFNSYSMLNEIYKQYITRCKGEKTLIFCCSVEHAEKVHELFNIHGVNSSIYHSKLDKGSNRKDIVKQFKESKDGILINVDVFTTGFDVTDVQNVILARSTRSLSLFLQIVGRGGRPHIGKDYFKVIDLGFNMMGIKDVFDGHGMWSDYRDWNYHFNDNKKDKDKEGTAPMKECPKCGGLNYISAKKCKNNTYNEDTEEVKECDYVFPEKTIELELKLGLISEPPILDLDSIYQNVINRGNKPHRAMHIVQDRNVDVLKIHGIDNETFMLRENEIIDKIWSNFDIFYKKLNKKDSDIKRVHYNITFWKEELIKKINNYYGNI